MSHNCKIYHHRQNFGKCSLFWNVGRSVALVCGGRFGVCLVIIELHSDHAIERERGERDHWPRVYRAQWRRQRATTPGHVVTSQPSVGERIQSSKKRNDIVACLLQTPLAAIKYDKNCVDIPILISAAVNCNQTARSHPAPDLLRKWQKLRLLRPRRAEVCI